MLDQRVAQRIRGDRDELSAKGELITAAQVEFPTSWLRIGGPDAADPPSKWE